jgi:hypothetical protein
MEKLKKVLEDVFIFAAGVFFAVVMTICEWLDRKENK